MDNIDEFGTKVETITPLDKAKDLYNNLVQNIENIDKISSSISKAEAESDMESLEQLYQNEFMLYMDNVGIFEDLINNLDMVEKTDENEFELARLRKGAIKMCRVSIVEVL